MTVDLRLVGTASILKLITSRRTRLPENSISCKLFQKTNTILTSLDSRRGSLVILEFQCLDRLYFLYSFQTLFGSLPQIMQAILLVFILKHSTIKYTIYLEFRGRKCSQIFKANFIKRFFIT